MPESSSKTSRLSWLLRHVRISAFLMVVGFVLAAIAQRLPHIEGIWFYSSSDLNFPFAAMLGFIIGPFLLLLAVKSWAIREQETAIIFYLPLILVIGLVSMIGSVSMWNSNPELKQKADRLLSSLLSTEIQIKNSKWTFELQDETLMELEIREGRGTMKTDSMEKHYFRLVTVENNSEKAIFKDKKKLKITFTDIPEDFVKHMYFYVMDENCLLFDAVSSSLFVDEEMNFCLVRQ